MPADKPNEDAKPKTRVKVGEIGRTGTINSDGWILGTETNSALRWPLSLQVFDNMRRTEISIRAMLGIVHMPLRAADCVPESVSDEEIDQEVAAFVLQVMKEIEGGWDDVIRRILGFLAMGFWLGEKVWEFRQIKYGDGKVRDAFVITRLPDRLQRTVQKWNEKNGKLVEIEQWLQDAHDEPVVKLPRDKCILIVNEQEGADYFGTSILRAAYGAFTNKRKLELIEAIGIERSIGVIVAYTPDSATDDTIDEVEAQLEKLHQAESMFLIAPGKKQQSNGIDSGNGWLFETLDVKGDAGTGKAHEAIERYKTELAQNVLAEFMRLGHNETGARATGDTQSNPYMDAVKAVGSQVCQVLREEFVTPLVRLNFGDDVEVPPLNFVGLEKVDTAAIADAFQKFATAGGITVTAKDEMHFRSLMGLPEIDEEEREKIQQEKIEQAQAAMRAKDDDDPKGKKPSGLKLGKDEKPEKAHEHFSAPRVGAFVPPRPLRGAEVHVSWDALDRSIDSYRAEFAMAGDGPMRAYARSYAETGAGDQKALADALLVELVDTARFGASQVAKELARQKHSAPAAFEARAPDLPPDLLAQLKERAEIAAQSIVTTVATTIKRVRIDQLRRRSTDAGAVIDAGVESGGYALRDEAFENITATLNGGRHSEALRQEVTIATYSSVLDSGTCAPCADDDGIETTLGSSTYSDLTPPNPECQGGNRCKCIWTYEGNESV